MVEEQVQTPPDAQQAIELPLYFELERRTSPKRLIAKIHRYAGYYHRLLKDDKECVIRPLIIVHHDDRYDRSRTRVPGAGAFALRKKTNAALQAIGGDQAHWGALAKALARIDRTLDVGRLVLLADWSDLCARDFEMSLYPVSPYAGTGADYGWTVGLDTVAHEWSRQVGIINESLGENR